MNQADSIQLELPANLKYLNVVSACINAILDRVDQLSEPATTKYSVELAVQETCANVVEHAYAGIVEGMLGITFTLTTAPRRLEIVVHDTGNSFDPTRVVPPDLEVGQYRGYGLYLVRELMDEIVYQSKPDGNYWRLVKDLT